MAKQRGFTILELLLAITIGAGIMVAIVNTAMGRARQRTFEQALESAQGIALVADANQGRVTATTIDPTTGIYTYTFGGRQATFTNATQLATEMAKPIPTATPYDTPYEYRGDGYPAQVRFVVPAAAAAQIFIPSDLNSSTDGAGNVTITVNALRLPNSTASRKLAVVKSQFYRESTR